MSANDLPKHFSPLFERFIQGNIQGQFELIEAAPPQSLISNEAVTRFTAQNRTDLAMIYQIAAVRSEKD